MSWNVRGLNAPNKRRLIKSQLDLMKCDVLLLQETKLSCQGADFLFSKWKLWNFCVSPSVEASGGLAFLWNDVSTEFKLVVSTPLWMWALSSLHGKTVVFGGDFNAISSDDEKIGGILPNKRILGDFSAFIHNNDLVDCKTLNGLFTWTNRRKDLSQIAERLDHFLVSAAWISSDMDVVASVLPYAGSDHFPIVLSILDDRAPGRSSFKFEPMWF
ncbi:uncharacterized protein LOC131866336 [Cryptomeria japonica]|uniref:uncharacterized protein LOC131866336 n=1 Tax=Cryptomeria japonica TaxID=3369 RepID=UPI0027DA6343|nr:uncharacterized protein LOC131866336 [Cryptomeria japonica]